VHLAVIAGYSRLYGPYSRLYCSMGPIAGYTALWALWPALRVYGPCGLLYGSMACSKGLWPYGPLTLVYGLWPYGPLTLVYGLWPCGPVA